jgi:HEAT repeat protein
LQGRREATRVRARCAEVMERIHDPRMLPVLRANLGELNDTVRVAVIHALPAFGESLTAPLLLQSLGGQRPVTRVAAAQGLGRLRSHKGTARLVGLLSDRNSDVVTAAARALGQIRDSAAAEPLAGLIRKPGTVPEAIIIRALAHVGNPALPAANGLLLDNRPKLRAAGIAVLARIGTSQAVSRLADALPDWECGPMAAEALDRLRWKPQSDDQAVHYLIAKRDNFGLFEKTAIVGHVLRADLDSDNRQAIENAAITLVALGTTEVVPRLIEVLGQEGSELLASTFVNSGLDTLARAGRDWAARHGYVMVRGGDSTGARWAGWK